MIESKGYEIRVGVVAIAALVLLIGGAILGNRADLSSDYVVLKIEFPNAQGITPSSPVYVNGIMRGEVKSIEPFRGAVLAKVKIDDIGDLKEDASARLSMLEITGGRKIEISPGESDKKLNPNKIIKGETLPDIADMAAMVGKFGEQGEEALAKFNELLSAANDIMGSRQRREKIIQAVDNLTSVVERLKKLSDDSFVSVKRAIKNLETFSKKINDAYDKYEPKIDEISSEAKVSLEKLRKALNGADAAIAETRSLLKKANEGDGLAAKILNDEAFAAKIDSLAVKLNGIIDFFNQYGVNVNVRLGTRP